MCPLLAMYTLISAILTGELTLLNTLSVEEAQTALHKNFYSFVSTSQYKRRLAMSYHVEQAKLSW